MEVSERLHCTVCRYKGGDYKLVIREYALKNNENVETGGYIAMDRQQFIDFVFATPDMVHVVRRKDITEVS